MVPRETSLPNASASGGNSSGGHAEPDVQGGSGALPARTRRIAHAVAAVVVVAGVLGYLQVQAYGIIGVDGYYHIRWSRLLWEGFLRGEIPEFTWLPLTILDPPRYVDHHFLFHVLQIPFTWFDDLILGAKASALVYGVAAILACYALILRYRAPWPLVWLVALLASSAHFLQRMTNPRAMSVTIVTLVVAIVLLESKRYVWVGLLGVPLVWMYSLFPLLLVLAVAWTFGDWWQSRRFDWRPIAFATAGLVAGLIVNPYFPENLVLLAEHAQMKVSGEELVAVGAEWYPLTSWAIVQYAGVALAAQVGGWLLIRPEDREASARTIALLLFSTFLGLLAFKARRFFEYWPPFAVIFLASAIGPWINRARATEWPAAWKAAAYGATAAVTLSVVGVLFLTVHQATQIDAPIDDPTVYAGVSRWLAVNTPESSLVFNADWDDFPMIFFYDTHNAYVSGLDPTYLLYANRDAAIDYDRICAGEIQAPGETIVSRFGARYVVSAKDAEHEMFLRRARSDRTMRAVFEDDNAVVFEIAP